MKELKEMKIWVLWRYVLKNGKMTKEPFSVSGGATGDNNKYSHTWATFEQALVAQKEYPGAGINFKVPDNYFFLDIDHKDLFDPFVQTIISRFEAYTEYSVSGNGIHIYGKCDISQLPTEYSKEKKGPKLKSEFYCKNSKIDLELYIGGLTNHFAAFTGNVIKNIPLKDCTKAVLTTLDKDMRKKPKVKYSLQRDGDKDFFDIVCELRKQKNAPKFSALYDNGDFSEYGSHSEADAALCALIAFRTGPNPAAIDEIFRSSALYRDKWEREDYRTDTIKLGIEACRGQFHQSVMPKPDFVEYNFNTKKEVVICSKLAKYIREDLNYIFVQDSGTQGVLRYVYENGYYRYYSDDMLRGVIKGYISSYNESLVKMSYVNETFGQLITDLNFVSHDDLNTHEDLINFQNGMLRLSDMELLPHSPEYLSTIQIPCTWTGKPTPTPVFDSYINTLANKDKAIIQLLAEFSGVCLSNVKGFRMKKSLFLVGAGDTGKSQLKRLVELLIGKGNYVSVDLSEIEARFGTSNIFGKRLAGSSDMSFMTVGELKTFKKCTGGDSLFAEFKGKNGFEFTYNGLLWFCMNKLPKFGGDDGKWVYERIMQVECKNVIAKAKQDKQLLDKMYAEREGIVYQFVMALKQVIANGYRYSEPESVTKARVKYMEDNNTVICFFHECMITRPEDKIIDACTTGKVFKVYKAWCNDNNHGFAKTATEFRTILAEYLGTTFEEMTTRRRHGNCYKTLTLSEETKAEYAQVYGYESPMEAFAS